MRSGIMRTLTALVLLAALTAGCQSLTGRTTGQTIDDATVTASVKSKLVADRAANLTRVNVDTTNGVVSLTGMVETPEQKTRAESLAREVDGVRRVTNNLQVEKR